MKTLTSQPYGLSATLPSGSVVRGCLSEGGEGVCFTFTTPTGEETRIGLSEQALAAMVEMNTSLRWRAERLRRAEAAHAIKAGVPLSWVYLLEWASGQPFLFLQESA